MNTEKQVEILIQKRDDEGATYQVKDHCLIVKLGSDLDHHVSVRVKEHSDRIIQAENIRHVIFDFSKSNFMDSSGLE